MKMAATNWNPLQEIKLTDQLIFKPGELTPASGQYVIVGPRGGPTGVEITSIQGHPLPPTPKPGQGFVLVDATHNGSGDGAGK